MPVMKSRRRARKGKPWVLQVYTQKPEFLRPKDAWLDWKYIEFVDGCTWENATITPLIKEATRLSLENALASCKELDINATPLNFRLLNVWTKEVIPAAAI